MSEEPLVLWTRTPEGVAFTIHVTPRARHEHVGGAHDGALRVAVTAAPSDGSANAACIQALAQALELRPAAIALDPHSKHRRKRVKALGSPEALGARLETLAATGSSD